MRRKDKGTGTMKLEKTKRDAAVARVLIAVIMPLVLQATALAEWHWQFPKPQGNTLWKTAFANTRYGYAVGDNGTIMATYDGAATWQLQYEGVTDNLRDVAVVDSVTAWAVGDNGMILHTTNGGYQWIEQNSGTANGLNGVFFLDRNRGWAGGDARTIVCTSDGGITWSKATMPSGSGTSGVNAIAFFSATEGYAVGYVGGMGGGGSISHTTDGGVTWTTASSSPAALQRLKILQGTNTAFAVGSGGWILATTNGGTTWTPGSIGRYPRT
jgi:photosystem II stability/assembly factor-like uncharacterized protein